MIAASKIAALPLLHCMRQVLHRQVQLTCNSTLNSLNSDHTCFRQKNYAGAHGHGVVLNGFDGTLACTPLVLVVRQGKASLVLRSWR